MTLRNYIILMLVATAACFFAFFSVVYFFDPFGGKIAALAFFYLSLFLSLMGAFSILGLLARLVINKDKLIFKKVVTSFRQSIWLALLVVVSLYLNKNGLFVWQNIIILIFALLLLELFFISYRRKPNLKI